MPRRTTSSAAAAPRAKDTSGGGGLEWELEREMLLMAAGGEHQKQQQPSRRPFAADLLQNCDLPPPAKLFGPLPTLQRLENAAAGTSPDRKSGDIDGGDGGDRLMRALRLSQSRAREAEEKLAAAGASNGELAALLVRDSVALSAHRRWVMMLEAENSALKGGGGAAGFDCSAVEDDGEEEEEEDSDGGRRRVAAWWLALAVCVGIAGVGLAMGKLLL